MAGVAGDSAGVICRHNLRKALRFSAVGFVAAGTHNGRVELRRDNGRGIVGMLGLGSMAGFARYHYMLALLLLLNYVSMAGLANIVAGEGHGAGRDLRYGSAAIMPILPKAAWDYRSTQDDERNYPHCHHYSEPDEVFDVLEQVRFPLPDCRLGP